MQQDFSAEGFGAPPQRKSNTGRNVVLILLSLMVGAVLLCCCCCIVIFAVFLREPVGVVTMWGSFITFESYESTSLVVCEGSQAARYTDTLKEQGATFSSFSANQNIGEEVVADATIVIDGQSSSWRGTFTTASGGTFGNCIDTIRVQGSSQ